MTEANEPPTVGRRLTRGEKQAFINSPAALDSKARDPHVQQRRRLYAESAEGVLAALAECGFAVAGVGELRQRGEKYQAAVPVLLEWLPRITYLPLVEDIIRTLSVPFAKKEALPVFLNLFRHPPPVVDPMRPATSQPPEEHIRWVIGNGLGIMAGPPVADELVELALVREYGEARSRIVVNLGKVKDPRVPDVLLDLLSDPTVAASAIEALGKMKYDGARERIVSLLDHADVNIRTQAKRALKRLDQ